MSDLYYTTAVEETRPRPRVDSNTYFYTVAKSAPKPNKNTNEPVYFDVAPTNRAATPKTSSTGGVSDPNRPSLPVHVSSRKKRSFKLLITNRKRLIIVIVAAAIVIVCAALTIGLTVGLLHERNSHETEGNATTAVPLNYATTLNNFTKWDATLISSS